jgi:hypothetical protein
LGFDTWVKFGRTLVPLSYPLHLIYLKGKEVSEKKSRPRAAAAAAVAADVDVG